MRKHYLVDVYLAKNLGDDLFVDHLATSFPDVDFTPFFPGNSYDAFFSDYANVHKFQYPLTEKIKNRLGMKNMLTNHERLAEQFDGVIFLGGGIFREESWWKEVHAFRKSLSLAFRKGSKKILWLGCNFGPFSSEAFRSSYRDIFAVANRVVFRDRYSQSLFTELSQVEYLPDLLWSYPIPKVEKRENTLGISVIDPAHKEGSEQYRQSYVEAHQKLISNFLKKGFLVELYSFCEKEGDLKIANEIRNGFANGVTVYHYERDLSEYLQKYGSCSHIVASRFHGCLLAMLFETPLLPVIYGIKTEKMLEDLNFENQVVHLENIWEITKFDFGAYVFPKIGDIKLKTKLGVL